MRYLLSLIFCIQISFLYSQNLDPTSVITNTKQVITNVKDDVELKNEEVKEFTQNYIDVKTKDIKEIKSTLINSDDSISKINARWVEPERVFEKPKVEELSQNEVESLESDKKFLENLPKSYDVMSSDDMKNYAKKIEDQIQKLIKEKEALLKSNASKEVIQEKENSINKLNKEKEIVDLSIETGELKVETDGLKVEKANLRKWIIYISIALVIMMLAVVALLQRKTIKVQDVEIERQMMEINKKNTYLEYAARIIRHDMHSGINTYIPRGLSSLQKRIQPDVIENLKIAGSIQMIQEGLNHTQKVYKNVYEFTNLVKVKVDFKKENIDLKESLTKYLASTSYSSDVEIEDLGKVDANEQLLCNAIDNLIRNGLKYNKSDRKIVKIYRFEDQIIVEDNGVGLQSKTFDKLIKKGVDFESETGLGLSITKAIVEEHGFSVACEEIKGGTKMKIKLT